MCAQLEQCVVDLQGDLATNQRWEGVHADGTDTYGRKISHYRPGYLYYNLCQDHIGDREQYLRAKQNTEMKRKKMGITTVHEVLHEATGRDGRGKTQVG